MMRPKTSPGGRISRAFFTHPQNSTPDPLGKAFLLVRDIPLGMMPLGGATDRPDFATRLEPADDAVAQWALGLLNVGQFARRTFPEAVVSFVDQIATDLAFRGESFYEILVDDSASEPKPTMLVPLPPGEIRRKKRMYVQILPAADRGQDQPAGIPIPIERMWHIRLPRALGTPEKHRAMLEQLSRQEPMPAFALQSQQLGADVGYDFEAHRAAVDIATERLTNAWGTIPSLQQVKGTTEYFYVARRLKFLRSQALVREHIIVELNRLLGRLGIANSVVVTGLPTAEAIAEQMDALENGEISFSAALAAATI